MNHAKPEALAELALFAPLSADAIDRITRHAIVAPVPAKTMMLWEGQVPDALYVVVDGVVQLFSSSDDHEATILMMQPGGSFVAASVLQNDASPVSARTVRPSVILTLPADEVRRLAKTDHGFAQVLIDDLARTCIMTMRELTSMRTRNAFQRLVAWTLAMHSKTKAASSVELPYDKAVLASQLGMAPETLSRNLARLGRLGVAIRGRRLHIRDAEKLRRLIKVDG